ncbi:hypothetical protein [Bacillus benzoevorans]|uniref:Lipoprotein n=1 Tax=Bacillus benzoevorans TaxID=1456 RepID=A0A7X0HRN5_9BACI|nr:hypothetical protein [Bacillus benzoevorans]MBB6444365.1 hypothetical protein [Bacillus benzoevorans]
MRKWFVMLIMSAIALALLVSCEDDKKVNQTTEPEETAKIDQEKDINDLVTIKEEVNREDTTPNGDIARYVYEVPVINIDTKGAQKINDRFFNLVKDMESQIGNGQNLTININSKAFLNDEIISVVMEIVKPGPGGIHTANYDIKRDKELSTKELIDKYNFDPKKLIAEINRQVEINEGKPEEEQVPFDINLFTYTIIAHLYGNTDEYFKKVEEMDNKTNGEKERFVIENIDKFKVYLNEDGHFVFIYTGALPDEELVVE